MPTTAVGSPSHLTMRRDDSTPFDPAPFDAEADDLATEFWGSTDRSGHRWSSGRTRAVRSTGRLPASRPSGRSVTSGGATDADETVTGTDSPTGSIDVTGAIAAIRDGVAAFRPQRIDRRDATGQVPRTRRHGDTRRHDAVRADIAEPRRGDAHETGRGTRSESTIGQLGAGAATFRQAGRRPGPAPDPFLDDLDDPSFDYGAYDDGGFAGLDEPSGQWTRARREPTGRHRATPVEPVAEIPLETLTQRLGLGAVDPLLARIGVLIVLTLLLVPFALALRDGGDDGELQSGTVAVGATGAMSPSSPAAAGDEIIGDAPAAAAATPAPDAAAAAAAGSDGSDETASAASAADTADAGTAEASPDPSEGGDEVGDTVTHVANFGASGGSATTETGDDADVAVEDAATADEPADRLVPECPQTYTAAAGDSWYGIADRAGITPAELLAENQATLDTTIFPGDDVCLPAGATVPSPPSSTAAPATTVAPTTAPATTAVTTTTTPATTTTVPVSPPPAEVEEIIRDVWPDELEEHALEIAFRESRYVATAHNGTCCYGLFQIYWSVHRGWLDDYGITTATDLYDARKNATAAYALYQRSGGWGPWGG